MHHRLFDDSHLVLTLFMVLAAAGSVWGQTPAEGGPLTFTVVGAPGPMKPGAVALVSVTVSHDLAQIEGEAAGHPVRFWRGATPREWTALAGVSADSAPGTIDVVIQGTTADGLSATTRVPLTVVRHRFETRRIRVDPKLVNPPESEIVRIKEEARAMGEAFAIVTPERFWRGRFDAPVPGEPNSSFGRLTVTNGRPSGRHQGTDFRAATGTPVRAPNAGRVVLAQNLYFAGNTVIIDHGLGIFSLLAHLSRIDVEAGRTVSRGDVVGESGATGRVTGPHLHWAIRFGEMTVDPLALMSTLASLPDDNLVQHSH
jgi:murein DD-endopeptidase MepM/ murein hydrolase activator NlpD